MQCGIISKQAGQAADLVCRKADTRHTFEKDDSSRPAFSISFSLNSLPTSLSGRDSSSMPRAVSLAWTGMPYSRSSRHTWHTFFAFATS